MTHLSRTELKKLKNNFQVEYKKVEPYIKNRRPLTKNVSLQVSYKVDLTRTYNTLINYIANVYSFESVSKQAELQAVATTARDKLVKSFAILNLECEFPENNFQQIEPDKITVVEILEEEEDDNENSELAAGTSKTGDTNVNSDLSPASSLSSLASTHSQNTETISNQVQPPIPDPLDNNEIRDIENTVEEENIEMAPMTKPEFLKTASSILNYKFNGDPLKLNSFISDVEMVNELKEADQVEICFKFIKAKLEGKALECITDDMNTVQQIIDALKLEIKPESSAVIEGKLQALKLIKGDFTKFTEEAEKLSEAFRRSLVVEGIPRAKAQEMTVKKTIDLCRKTARSDVVKSVLSSAKFDQPGDVIAKFVTESDIARKEKQLADNFRNQKSTNPKFHQHKKFDKNKQFNKTGHSNSNKFSNGNFQKKNYNGRNFPNKNNNKNQNNRQNEQTIRIVSGNAPSTSSAGPSNAQPQEQYFHIPFSG